MFFRRNLRFSEVSHLCDSFGVELTTNSAVLQAGQLNDSGLGNTVEPYNTFAAINQAGNQLHKYPDRALTGNPIPTELIDIVPDRDIAARSLLRIIQNSLEPAPAEEPFTNCKPAPKRDVCGQAEHLFGANIASITGRRQPALREGFQIIKDEGNRPLLFRKGGGIQTALSLTALTIRGISFPAGSIMSVDLSRDHQQGAYYMGNPIGVDKEVVAASEVARISFLRLSAYAYPPGLRKSLFRKHVWHSETAWDMPMADICQAIAQEAANLTVTSGNL